MKFKSPVLISTLGLVAFILNLFASIYFYLERCVMPDMAFMIFHIANKPKLFIQHSRYIAAFTLSFLDLASHLKLGLKAISISYSSSFPILFLICFLLIAFYFKNYRLTIVFILYHFLILSHSFFWPLHEILQAVSILIVYLAYYEYSIDRQNLHRSFWIISFGTFFILVFSHPLVIIPIMFLFVWRYVSAPKLNTFDLKLIAITGLLLLTKLILIKNPYEQGAMANLNNFVWYFPKYHHFISFKLFLQYIIADYYWLIPLYLFVQIYYIIYWQWKKLLVFNSFFIGLILLINICYKDGAEQFYLESQFSLLGFFIAFPLAYDLFSKLNPKLTFLLILLFITSFYFRIFRISKEYHARIELYRSWIDNDKKMIISSQYAPMKTLKMSWCSSFEIWLLSTIETGRSSSILIHENPSQFDWTIRKNDVLITNWEVFEYKDLNPKYFIFKDSSIYKKYRFVNRN